jgi:hypothetical protein
LTLRMEVICFSKTSASLSQLHGVITLKTVLFIVATMRISDTALETITDGSPLQNPITNLFQPVFF